MYSIWLMPSGREFERYNSIIKQLSQQFDTSSVEPHITLFTGIPSLSDTDFYQISVLAALTTSFDVTLSQLDSTDDFYKAFFLKATNSDILTNLNKELKELFTNINYDFQPHLSLLYHSISATEQAELKARFHNICGIFEATHISIVKTQGVVDNWKIIETFPFHKTDTTQLNLISDVVEELTVFF